MLPELAQEFLIDEIAHDAVGKALCIELDMGLDSHVDP